MKTYWYEVDGGDRFEIDGPSWAYDLTHDQDQEALVDDCAEDYHKNHDGWEDTWPLKFSIAETEDGPIIATFNVERDYTPMFCAYKCPA